MQILWIPHILPLHTSTAKPVYQTLLPFSPSPIFQRGAEGLGTRLGYSVAYALPRHIAELSGRCLYVLRRCMNIYEAHMSPVLNGAAMLSKYATE